MIRLLVRHASQGFRDDISPGQISDLLTEPGHLIWLDMEAPTAEERALLGDEFGFHPLAIEDIGQVHPRPKVDQYEEFYFVVLYAPARDHGGEEDVAELAAFVGPNYVVTVHAAPMPALDEVATRFRASADVLGTGVSGLLYALLDAVVDAYFPVVDALGERIDDLEDQIFATEGARALQPIFETKRQLLALRRILGPQRDVVNTLMRRELPLIEPQAVVYFQDIYDHLVRLTDSVDTFRDLTSSALDAYLSVVSNRLNQVMKTLTAMSIILMSLALIAGIYGMNFRHMPELTWRFGYAFALTMMGAVGLALVAYFRRKGWL